MSVNCNGSGLPSLDGDVVSVRRGSWTGDDPALEPRLEEVSPAAEVGERRPLLAPGVGDNRPPRSANIFCSNGDLNLLAMPPTGELLLGTGDLVLEPKIPTAGPLLGNGDLVTLPSMPLLLLLGPLLRDAVVPLLTVDGACTVTGGASLWRWDSAVVTVGPSGDGDCVTYTAHDAHTSRKREKRSKIQKINRSESEHSELKVSKIILSEPRPTVIIMQQACSRGWDRLGFYFKKTDCYVTVTVDHGSTSTIKSSEINFPIYSVSLQNS